MASYLSAPGVMVENPAARIGPAGDLRLWLSPDHSITALTFESAGEAEELAAELMRGARLKREHDGKQAAASREGAQRG